MFRNPFVEICQFAIFLGKKSVLILFICDFPRRDGLAMQGDAQWVVAPLPIRD